MKLEELPPPLRRSPFLSFRNGEVYFSWWLAANLMVLGIGIPAGLLLYSFYTLNAWIGPPLILGGALAFGLFNAVQFRRQLRWAKQGDRYRWSKLPLSDSLLLLTAIALLFGGYAANVRMHDAEAARQESIDQAALAILGPGGLVERDFRDRIEITIADPTFDDARTARLVSLLAEENARDGVARIVFDATRKQRRQAPEQIVWPNVTDAAIDDLLAWEELRIVRLRGTAVSPEAAERLAGLPRLIQISTTEPFDDAASARVLEAYPDLFITTRQHRNRSADGDKRTKRPPQPSAMPGGAN